MAFPARVQRKALRALHTTTCEDELQSDEFINRYLDDVCDVTFCEGATMAAAAAAAAASTTAVYPTASVRQCAPTAYSAGHAAASADTGGTLVAAPSPASGQRRPGIEHVARVQLRLMEAAEIQSAFQQRVRDTRRALQIQDQKCRHRRLPPHMRLFS